MRRGFPANSPAASPLSVGTATIEFALILPILALLITGLFDLGFAAYESMQVQAAAEAGAQYAVRNAWNPAAIATAVAAGTGTSGITALPAPSQFCACPASGNLTPVACSTTCANGSPASTYVLVMAQMQHWTVLPYPGLPHPLTITAQAYRRIQ